jgi:hypothetical protein
MGPFPIRPSGTFPLAIAPGKVFMLLGQMCEYDSRVSGRRGVFLTHLRSVNPMVPPAREDGSAVP